MSDPRFSRLKTDPRFRRPKKKQHKVVVDDRFKSVFESSKPTKKKKPEHKVDKYGRKLAETHEEDNLKRYYRLAHDSDQDQDDEKEQGIPTAIDYARGAVLMESSDEEGEGQAEEMNRQQDEDEDSSDVDGIVKIGGGDDDEVEIDLDEDTYAELDAQVAAYANVNKNLEEQAQKEDVGIENRTRRLALVNLDWDYVRASHLYKILSSLVSPTAPYAPVSATSSATHPKKAKGAAAPRAKGTVLSVRVYPSEFGKARMEREEREGPPAEVFKKTKRKDSEEINEKIVHEVGDEDEYDEDALRRYQLERLRYYYAIVECDTVEAASHIYNELDGTELERSANVFDISFVPDDMTFDAEPRDEATEDVSTDYKPLEYVTDALRHSKVKLKWDEDDPERYQVTRRQLTQKEIEEADFKAYIASSSSDEEENEVKTKDKETSRQRLRALLLGGNKDTMPEGWANNDADSGQESDVDMEITFTPGLSEQKNEDDETTLDIYQRKMKEKRRRRKEEKEVKASGKEKGKKERKGDLEGDEFFEGGSSSEDEDHPKVQKSKKHNQIKQREERSTSPTRKESTAEELALIAASDNVVGNEPKHFDMKAVLKAEKRKGRKGKKGKANEEENELQEDFKINVNDERFKILHDDHQFAIDPTNPHFKKTKGMKALLDERQRRQKGAQTESFGGGSQSVANDSERSLKTLVESVKRKSQGSHGGGKRRKL